MKDKQSLLTSLDDLDRTMQGLLAFVQHLKATDEVTVSLSVFSATSAIVHKGQVAEYSVKLVNNSMDHLWLALLVDIYARENQSHPAGHHAFFRKELLVPSRSSQKLAFYYNWQDSAAFLIDGYSFAPDRSWFGPFDAPAEYLVWARLYLEGGELAEELALLQHLE